MVVSRKKEPYRQVGGGEKPFEKIKVKKSTRISKGGSGKRSIHDGRKKKFLLEDVVGKNLKRFLPLKGDASQPEENIC